MTGKQEHPAQNAPDWEAIARFLAGESSPAEAEAVARWLAEDPAGQAVARLQAPVERLRAAPAAGLDVEAALRRVHERMARPALSILAGGAAPAPRRRPAWLAPALSAAVLALLVGGALLARRYVLERAGGPAVLASAVTYRAPVGERRPLRLPDGSEVLLGPGSVLTLAAHYPAVREAVLEGEALFTVKHDAAHPFAVRVGGALVRDVGTRFDVRGEPGARVRVAVFQGAVALSVAGQAQAPLLLRAGEAGAVAPDGRAARTGTADPAQDLAWMSGQLVFRGAPVPEIAAALRRWYGVELRIGDPALARQHLTTSFAGESRERVLQSIALALGARLELHGDTATLTTGDASTR